MRSEMNEKPEEPAPVRPEEPVRISAHDARGGEIILRTRRRRMIFIGGLVGLVLLAVILRLAAVV